MMPHRDPADASVGTLLHRLLDDGRDYVKAEIDLVRDTARARLGSAKTGIIVGVAAIFVAQAGLTVLFIALGSILALLVGPWAGQLIAALIALAAAGLMVKYTIAQFSPGPTSATSAKAEEKA